MRHLASFVFHRLLRWKISGGIPHGLKKAVVIVAPHTSWHDFYIGAFARKVIDLRINYVAKKELFRWPFGWYFRWMGGTPIDRSARHNKVEEVVKIFNSRSHFLLTITPEGTRKKVKKWKTGFYHIAHQAGVPIVPIAFDHGTRIVRIFDLYRPTGNIHRDLPEIQALYKGVVGKVERYS